MIVSRSTVPRPGAGPGACGDGGGGEWLRDTWFRRIYVTLLDPIRPEAQQRTRRRGRLCDSPHVTLQPLRHPVDDFWTTAPGWLSVLARLPLDQLDRRLGERLRHGLPTDVVARVPLWIPDVRDGYVMDFLLPEFSVGVVIDREGPDRWDWWGPMHSELRSIEIEALRYRAAVVRDDPAHVVAEIRSELGLFDK